MTDSNGNTMVMPVAPYYGGNGGGFSDFGGNGWWIILLLLCLGGGWGGGFGGFGNGGMFPWMMAGQGNTNNDIQRGFDQNAIMTGLSGVQSAVTSGFGDTMLGIAGINQNICQTGNGITGAVRDGFYGSEIAANGRAMSNMQQLFGIQTAVTDCCCKQSANTADLKYTIATEAANTRASGTANTQAIMDKLCQLELDGVKAELASAQRENIALQNQLNMAALRESQTAQNAFIQQGFSNEVDALYNRLSNCPVPSTPVYGRTPIFTCGGNGCGCGMAA